MNKKVSIREIWNKNRLLFTALITMVILSYPIGFIHEFGHILVCVSNGYDYIFTVDELAFNVQCSQTPEPVLIYYALGGIFGLISSVSLFLSKRIRKNRGIFIGVIGVAFDHFVKAIFETFAHTAYLQNSNLLIFMSILPILLVVVIWRFFEQSSKKKT